MMQKMNKTKPPCGVVLLMDEKYAILRLYLLEERKNVSKLRTIFT